MKLNPYFGRFGGQFVPEILIPALDQLEEAFIAAKDDPTFQQELHTLLTDYAGRPTPLTKCRNLTQGTKTTIYLKRVNLVSAARMVNMGWKSIYRRSWFIWKLKSDLYAFLNS